MHIVIPDDYQNAVASLDCFAKLAGHTVTIYTDSVTHTDLRVERFAPADALVLIRERTRITRDLLARLPRLKLIAQTGRGIPHIDLAACADYGVTVTTGGGSPYATAELTWALALAARRHIPYEVSRLKSGHWQSTFGQGMHGRILGIYGYGNIGAVVAGYGRAFGMRVVVHGREGSLARAAADGYEPQPDRAAFFAQSDVLTVHVKLTPETRGIVTLDDLSRMKPDALIVNTSRADLIAPGALLAALQNGRPGYAAVDVFEREPAIDDPLLALDNVTATPHIGYVEKESYEAYFGAAFDNLVNFVNGTPSGVVT